MLALIISRLDLESQTKFQMFTLYSGRHLWVAILVHHGCTPTWRFHTGLCKFLGNIYDEYLKFGETHRPTTWRTVLFLLAFSIGWLVLDLLFFYCVTVKTIYTISRDKMATVECFFWKMIKLVF